VRRGFTLIELIVVLMIVAMVAGVVGPRMFMDPGGQSSKAASEVAGLFHAARNAALSQGMPARLELNTGTGEYHLTVIRQWRDSAETAESTIMTGALQLADDVRITPALVEIDFEVDGTVKGVSVVAQGADGTTVIGFTRWTGDLHVHR
jgi:type II secretion system protein H